MHTSSAPKNQSEQDPARLTPEVVWEYFNGREWSPITPAPSSTDGNDLDKDALIRFQVPPDMVPTEVNGEERLWVRVRLVKGGFGSIQRISFFDETTQSTNHTAYIINQPPALSDFRLGYTWQYGPFAPQHVLTYDDFQYEDHTDGAQFPGQSFKPFNLVADTTPALYVGSDRKLPTDRLNLYFDIVEKSGEKEGPALNWEFWDGFSWDALTVEDETNNLRVPGMVSFIGPETSQPLSRFSDPLHWLRARLAEDGPPVEPSVDKLFLNAVYASQQQTLVDIPLGTSTGQPNQVFTFARIPVLSGEVIEVRELSGQQANVEWRILAMQLFDGDTSVIQALEVALGGEGPQRDIQKGFMRLRRDRNKRVSEVWVQWENVDQLLLSKPGDRHYALDRTRGRLLFGDGQQGKIPPLGAAIHARQFQTGGGRVGNVAFGTITQAQAAIGDVESVFNPKPAEGGADAETLEALSSRGPKTLRHRGRSVTTRDYEMMAKDASPAVAFVRAMPTTDAMGIERPGSVTLLIIPESQEPRPQPSFALREHVRRYIEARISADLAAASRLYVTGPKYQLIDVEATMVPRDLSEAGIVRDRTQEALNSFFHPLRGGPEGLGWALGRDVFLSDVASVMERVEGIDFVKELALAADGVLQQERVQVPGDCIVVAGAIRLIMSTK